MMCSRKTETTDWSLMRKANTIEIITNRKVNFHELNDGNVFMKDYKLRIDRGVLLIFRGGH